MILLSISSSVGSFFQLLSVLFIFVVVLLLTYLTTRWIAGYQKTQIHNKNLSVIETLKITPNKYIQIIESGKVYLVIAITKDHVTLLTTLEKDELKDFDPTELNEQLTTKENFTEILNKIKEHIPKK